MHFAQKLDWRLFSVWKTHPQGVQIKIPYNATCQTLANSKYQPFFAKNQKMRNVQLSIKNVKPQVKNWKFGYFWPNLDRGQESSFGRPFWNGKIGLD